ncbi:MAG TPA: hypothetical protein VEK07_21555 [Polyangiaceae bacterium]|nr:hypothetical protein [Polyangiaceae bacterium]
MNCEKFEAAMMEELFGDLDEVASRALRRHCSGCARCSATFERLRTTQALPSSRPLSEPPVTLQEPMLEAAGPPLRADGRSKRSPPSVAALGRRFADIVSVAGNWAMRPETAMAALFLVMTGTSVLLLRGKSSRAPANAAITVTEEGSPAPSMSATSPQSPVEAPATTAAAPRASERYPGVASTVPPLHPPAPSDDMRSLTKAPASPPGSAARSAGSAHDVPIDALPAVISGSNAAASVASAAPVPSGEIATPYASALSAYQAGRFDDARRVFDAIASGDATAELWAARSVREERGCSAAIGRFDRVAQRATGTAPGWDALFEGARCRTALGDYAGARSRFEALANVDAYRDRVQAELDRIARVQQGTPKP